MYNIYQLPAQILYLLQNENKKIIFAIFHYNILYIYIYIPLHIFSYAK